MKRNIAASHREPHAQNAPQYFQVPQGNSIGQGFKDEATPMGTVDAIPQSAPRFMQEAAPSPHTESASVQAPGSFASAAEPFTQSAPVTSTQPNAVREPHRTDSGNVNIDGAPYGSSTNTAGFVTQATPNADYGIPVTNVQFNAVREPHRTDTGNANINGAPLSNARSFTQSGAPYGTSANLVQQTAAPDSAPAVLLDTKQGEGLVAQMLSVVGAKEALLGAALSQVTRWTFSANTVTGFVSTPFLKNKLESEVSYVSSVLTELYGAPIRFITELSAATQTGTGSEKQTASKKAELLCNVFKGTVIS